MHGFVTPRWLFPSLAVFSVVGASLAFLSLLHFVEFSIGVSTGPSFCNINSAFNCDIVTQSKYSIFLGVPLASWGLLFYLFIFGLTLFVAPFGAARVSAVDVVFTVSSFATVISIILLIISEFIIGSLCLLCVGMYILNFFILYTSYRGGRDDVLTRLVSGLSLIFSAPLRVLGVLRGTSRFRVGSCLFLVCVIGLFFLPDVIASVLIARKPIIVPGSKSDPVLVWSLSKELTLNLSEGEALTNDYVKGSKEAPIEIVEYSDFECPGCRKVYQLLEGLMRTFDGKYRFVFKNFPLDRSCNSSLEFELHHNACLAANAARCAGEQGKFWESVDHLFTMESFDNGSPPTAVRDEILKLGQTLGLDGDAFSECISSKRYERKIQSDISEGMAIGVKGTPTILVNRKLVPAISNDALTKIFNSILSEHSAK